MVVDIARLIDDVVVYNPATDYDLGAVRKMPMQFECDFVLGLA